MKLELFQNGLFRLALVALFVLTLERLWPWRKKQDFARPLLLQDVVWLALNVYFFGIIAGPLFTFFNSGLNWVLQSFAQNLSLLSSLSLPLQIIIILVAMDFVEWLVHNLLHRVSWLWKFHRVHHSIHFMDWIGKFRFHPFELVVYHLFKYLPMAISGASKNALIISGTFALLIGCLNHANLKISWGPLKYIFNSPVMHLWHHEAFVRNKAGVNLGIVFSFWDWIFKTAYMPRGKVPNRIGFNGDETYPTSFLRRLFVPFLDK